MSNPPLPLGIAVTVNRQREKTITHRTVGLRGMKHFFLGLSLLWAGSSFVAMVLTASSYRNPVSPMLTVSVDSSTLLQAALGSVATMYFLWAFFKHTQLTFSTGNIVIVRRLGPFRTTSTYNKTTFTKIALMQTVGRSETDSICAFSAVGVLPNNMKIALFSWQERAVAHWLSTKLNDWLDSDGQNVFSGYDAMPQVIEVSDAEQINPSTSIPRGTSDLNAEIKIAIENKLYGITEDQSKSTTVIGGVAEIFFHKVIKKLALGLILLTLVIAYIELIEPRLAKNPVANQKSTPEKTNGDPNKKGATR
jgi:hypothetical protein